ncbi:MAG: hypothetical protein Q8N47_25065 [Bryobacterales bacterium]|nr:hypothetical protein [Bryobacterales bacterium]
MSLRRDLLDAAVAEQVLKTLQPAETDFARAALEEFESRDQTLSRQWRWNDAPLELDDLKKQAEEFQRQEARVATPERKAKAPALARDLPRLWNAPSTQAKDRKRMLRLLIKDITVEELSHHTWALSRGFALAGFPARTLASYQLSEWGLPPLVIRALGAHDTVPDFRAW